MTIWQIRAADGADLVTYFEPTKGAAETRKRLLLADGYEDIELEPWRIDPTRIGIARALQNVIDMLCANEH
jgi:hypothetical protein